MKGSPDHCPHCQTQLTLEQILTHRPFSCPSCELLINPRPNRNRLFVTGCLTTAGLIAISAVGLGIGWAGAVPLGLLFGLVVWTVLLSVLDKVWPRPPSLKPHEIRTANYPFLADSIECILTSEEWTPEFDRKLVDVKQCQSYDEDLENYLVALILAYKGFKNGNPSKEFLIEGKIPTLDELRRELKAVARDMRLGEKSCKRIET